ncbi:hypothetical protein IWQ62_001571 [Dispira parvispora]|uniref:NFACT RNA-binding domain-containing protein n=1 Tax=Dispira parvispora TaxID=1520584 RepID=A0A9W8AS29_9FUNG|nr:hypothetical protein IWQ62_001571 [Dispira parvispora]
MKQRFSALDICASVSSIRPKLVDLRLQNIYDVTPRTFLFKFARPETKAFLVIESGIRVHTTQFTREKATTPSGFCIKLRKHLRTRRLTNIRQLGMDRIVDLEFAGGERLPTYHIIAEFYASGNIILTDEDYKIIALLRVVQPNENTRIAVGQHYDTQTQIRSFQPMNFDALPTILAQAGPKDTLRKFLHAHTLYGPALLDHVLLQNHLNPALRVVSDLDTSLDSPQMQQLRTAMSQADACIERIMTTPSPGYIVLASPPASLSESHAESDEVFKEFHPYRFAQFEDQPVKAFDTFDQAVDTFFSLLESQKLTQAVQAQENAARRRLDDIRHKHFDRIKGLEQAQQQNVAKAELIQVNKDLVDQAIRVIRNAVASGMNWKDIGDLLEHEREQGNPVAKVIHELDLKRNEIILSLRGPVQSDEDLFSTDDDDDIANSEAGKSTESSTPTQVAVDIYLSVFSNAQRYYDHKKYSAKKHEKSVAVSTKALKSAEHTIRQSVKEQRITLTINKMRKPYWFERFLWFISSEGYLVLAGRDMQQNELLVQKHLDKHDIYVHADLHGAASVIVKNHGKGEIPATTLVQAGIMSVCQSKAWEAKIITSAWWVGASQVSKSAPTGEYLTTGSFMIRGKKTFLPPCQLVYGFGFLFRLEESCIGRHLVERRKYQVGASDSAPLSVPPVESTFNQTQSKYNLDELNRAQEDEDAIHERLVQQLQLGTSEWAQPAHSESSPSLSTARQLSAKEKRQLRKRQQKQNRDKSPQTDGSAAQGPKAISQGNALSVFQTSVREAPVLTPGTKPTLDTGKSIGAHNDNTPAVEQLPSPIVENLSSPLGTPAHTDSIEVEQENEEIRQLLLEENIVPLDTEESLSLLDTLTPTPFADDILLGAIPVCAPYSALQKYKYKVKLTPGNLKKGKASKTALALFLNAAEATPREKELMKSVPETELIAQMLGKVKLSAPNLEAAKKKSKKKSK